MPDVLVVGAGLAGLAAALHLDRAGLDVAVLERGSTVGGRVRTAVVDGFRCDRGFQVLDTAYPELPRVVDLAALDLRPFDAGALVVHGGRPHRLRDPRRHPAAALATARDPLLPLAVKARLGAYTAGVALAPAAALTRGSDRTTERELAALGLVTATDRFLRPLLSGVLLERDLATSARYFRLLWRSFARGDQALPAAGMQALPDAIAAQLPASAVRLGTPVEGVAPGEVRAGGEVLRADEVVVATDPATAGRLLSGLPPPAPMKGVTTVHYAAPEPPLRERLIVLDADRAGPITSTAVLTETAPSYAADGRALVSASVLGPLDEPALRRRLSELYDTSTTGWDVVDVAAVAGALPSFPPGTPLRRPVRLAPGLLVCGDHRDTPSTQGALVSGRRAARAVLRARGLGDAVERT